MKLKPSKTLIALAIKIPHDSIKKIWLDGQTIRIKKENERVVDYHVYEMSEMILCWCESAIKEVVLQNAQENPELILSGDGSPWFVIDISREYKSCYIEAKYSGCTNEYYRYLNTITKKLIGDSSIFVDKANYVEACFAYGEKLLKTIKRIQPSFSFSEN
ncbi:MAG: hypothetical protein PHE67_00450 [Campylobacterales bacterium]|nr:hypothetical protein [Campylobacterales bacterium]